MKTYLTFFVITFFSISLLSGQKATAHLIFKDGREIKGLGFITLDGIIKFKPKKKGRYKKFSFDSVHRATITNDKGSRSYLQFPVQGEKEPQVVIELIKDTLSLYYVRNISSTSFNNFGGFNNNGSVDYFSVGIENYYLKKKESDSLFKLGSNRFFSKNFDTVGADYFANCESLSNLIREKYYTKKDIVEIVKYYNNECN